MSIKKLNVLEKTAKENKKPLPSPKQLIALCEKKFPGLLEALKNG